MNNTKLKNEMILNEVVKQHGSREKNLQYDIRFEFTKSIVAPCIEPLGEKGKNNLFKV